MCNAWFPNVLEFATLLVQQRLDYGFQCVYRVNRMNRMLWSQQHRSCVAQRCKFLSLQTRVSAQRVCRHIESGNDADPQISALQLAPIYKLCGAHDIREARMGSCSCGEFYASLCLQYAIRNLVDPASSHMLVSRIKPCMSQYKLIYYETANGSLKQL